MTARTTILRTFPNDRIGRAEPTADARMFAMAEDALASRHDDDVEQEAERVRAALGLDRATKKEGPATEPPGL